MVTHFFFQGNSVTVIKVVDYHLAFPLRPKKYAKCVFSLQCCLLTRRLLMALSSESINFQHGQLVQTSSILELTAQSPTTKQQKDSPKATKQEIWYRRT